MSETASIVDDPLVSPEHVVARRTERRWIARGAVALLAAQGTFISTMGIFDAQIAMNISTIWPLLGVIFGTYAAIVCTYFGVGASENNRITSILGLAGKLV